MKNNSSAKFAFFYVLSLVALIFTTVSVGIIIFQIIDKNIVDVLGLWEGRYNSDALKFAISTIIIAAPIYYLTIKQIYKNLKSGAIDRDAGVRRWLTYFILLVSIITMLGWLVAVIDNYLDGELTTKFILKALTAIGIAVVISSFYFYDIRREKVDQKDRVFAVYLYGTLTIIIAAFIASLFTVESPKEARRVKADENITRDLYHIRSAINRYYRENEKLPEKLTDLSEVMRFITNEEITDETSGKEYEYRILDEKRYELCAEFQTASEKALNRYEYPIEGWPHTAGRQCFSRKIRAGAMTDLP